jgi:hypothetical protein
MQVRQEHFLLDSVLDKVHLGTHQVHKRCRVNQYAHPVLLHKLIKPASVICITKMSLSRPDRSGCE